MLAAVPNQDRYTSSGETGMGMSVTWLDVAAPMPRAVPPSKRCPCGSVSVAVSAW